MSATPILSVQNVSVDIDRKTILKNINFEIFPGESVALIGPSGSGKSTLLNILSKTIQPTQGEVFIDGRPSVDISHSKEYAKYIGIIHQQFDLIKELPVIHNVLAGRLNEWGFWKSFWSLIHPQDSQQALAALDQFGIGDKAKQVTASLSGGEQQRVAMAKLVLQNPKIVLVDEPVSALDPTKAQEVLSLLKSLVDKGDKTLITSIHSVNYIDQYFDRMIALKDGHVCFDKASQELTPLDLETLYGRGGKPHDI